MKIWGGHFAPKLGGHFELESGGHFKLELGGQYHWNLHIDSQSILENESKIELVKETLDEIYSSFNSNIVVEDDSDDLL